MASESYKKFEGDVFVKEAKKKPSMWANESEFDKREKEESKRFDY
jgi:hypothetical protein